MACSTEFESYHGCDLEQTAYCTSWIRHVNGPRSIMACYVIISLDCSIHGSLRSPMSAFPWYLSITAHEVSSYCGFDRAQSGAASGGLALSMHSRCKMQHGRSSRKAHKCAGAPGVEMWKRMLFWRSRNLFSPRLTPTTACAPLLRSQSERWYSPRAGHILVLRRPTRTT